MEKETVFEIKHTTGKGRKTEFQTISNVKTQSEADNIKESTYFCDLIRL
jgi:hypothetical protein